MDRNLRLLLTEIRVLWGQNAWGRAEPPPLCALAVCAAGYRLTAWPGLDEEVWSRLRPMLAKAARRGQAAGLGEALAPALAPALALLEAAGIAAEVHGGPSYLAEPPLAQPEQAADPAAAGRIVRSGVPADLARLAGCRPPPSWQAGEWAELLGGRLGPWAMLVLSDQVASICHTSRDSRHGAEAGVWTDPAFRGHGYAKVTTAAWASLLRERDGRPLFYSTSAGNQASQRVAAGLGLTGIGWIWRLQAAAPKTGALS